MRTGLTYGLLMASLMGGAVATNVVGCTGDDPALVATVEGPTGGGGGTTGTGAGDGAVDAGPRVLAKDPSRGAAIAISEDDRTIVVANRDVGTVSVFRVALSTDGSSPPQLTRLSELSVGAEPWQVVIAPDGETAYVVLRKDQKLVRITGLGTTPVLAGSVSVGSEPTGVALTPAGTTAWVTSWVDGTVVGIDTATMTKKSTVDLNGPLAVSGLLGPDVSARPALAHPRSIAITNDGDEDESDESLLVTEYFAQRAEKTLADGSNADRTHVGVVYRIKLEGESVQLVRLAPLADMGFADSAGAAAGCFPNQLQSITIQGNRAFVTSVCASPKGPIGVTADGNVANVKTTTHGMVSVVDVDAGAELTASTASLNARWDALYAERATPDDGSRRYGSVPVDLAFASGTGAAYVVSNAADAVFRMLYDLAGDGAIKEVGAANATHIDLAPSSFAAAVKGQNPIGIATSHLEANRRWAFVANDVSRNVSVLDFNAQGVAGSVEQPVVVESTALPRADSVEEHALEGKRFFNTGTGRWSLKGQGWGSCQACHMDGLTDNVTWFFARGPRQSISLDGMFSKKDPTDQRILNWTAIFDEAADFELNTRGISGGVGAIVSAKSTPPQASDRIDVQALGHAGLAGSARQAADPTNPAGLATPSQLTDWEEIQAFLERVRSPRAPTNTDPDKVAEGRKLFTNEGACQGCHGGDKWTISSMFYTPSTNQSAALAQLSWSPPAGFPSTLLPASTVGNRKMRFGGANPAAFDQIQCVLRPVGTFGTSDAYAGVAELRADMSTAGQGNEVDGKGFNPPSLLGLSTGAPYLHAGGATTLESLLSTGFGAHYAALAPNFLADTDPAARSKKVAQLVQFLLSLDEASDPVAVPAAGAQGGSFCAAQ